MLVINAQNSNKNDKNGYRSKFDRRRFKAKRDVALIMATGNVFQSTIDLNKELISNSICTAERL